MDIETKEKEIMNDLKQEESMIKRFLGSSWTLTIALVIILLAIAGGIFYWKIFTGRVYIENALVSAPAINLTPTKAGTLQELYVHEGDVVAADTPVARVGNEIIKTQVESRVIKAENNIGKSVNPGEAVVTVIQPSELRVVGTLEEDKGLSDIQAGQTAIFTVDTFGSKKYTGIVDQISPTAHAGDVVFNISDQRQVSQYDVKVRFDVNQYPELKNGMSAKLWIYTR